MKATTKAWLNLLLLAGTLFINTMGAIGKINGLSQKEISDRFVTLITPSPSTFSIWSVIYSLLIISVIVMLIKKKDEYYKNAVEQISGLFWISCILNIAWIVSFSYVQLGLSVIFILGFVITLSLILQKLRKIQSAKKFLLPLAFGLYAGWLFIATVVNIAAWLVKLNWGGFGLSHQIWAIIILAIAVLLTLGVNLKNHNAIFPFPIAWAYLGIYQFLKSFQGFNGAYPQVQTVALIGMVLLILIAAYRFYKNRFLVTSESK